MKSRFVFHERKSNSVIPTFGHAWVNVSSHERAWDGVLLEVVTLKGMNAEDVTVDGHLVVFNPTDTEWLFETRNENELDWVFTRMPPQTFLIIPEGRPCFVRQDFSTSFVIATIDGKYLDTVAGHHYELRQHIGIADGLLALQMRSLVTILHERSTSCEELEAELVKVFVLTLAKRHGYPAEELSVKGGIAPHQVKSLQLWLHERLADAITVDVMASRTGLSVAHFSREFKRSTGLTPWGYVVKLRLDRACELMNSGGSLSAVASKCGFSSLPHLCRMFKQQYGMSPMTYVKRNMAK